MKTPHKKCFSRDIYSRFAKYAAVKPTIVESKAAFDSSVSVGIQFCSFLHILLLFDITVFRPKMEAVSPRRKSMRIVFMADRIRSGEFNGSVRLAARSPITLSMEISCGAMCD